MLTAKHTTNSEDDSLPVDRKTEIVLFIRRLKFLLHKNGCNKAVRTHFILIKLIWPLNGCDKVKGTVIGVIGLVSAPTKTIQLLDTLIMP